MTAVIDSSALIVLARLDLLHVLPDLFSTVLLPEAVREEVLSGKSSAPDIPRLLDAISAGQITVHSSDAATRDDPGLSGLGSGERDAILLAFEAEADTTVLDDRTARRQALRLGLHVVGTLGVLALARDEGHIAAVARLLEALREEGFRLAPALIEGARRGDPDGGGRP